MMTMKRWTLGHSDTRTLEKFLQKFIKVKGEHCHFSIRKNSHKKRFVKSIKTFSNRVIIIKNLQ